MRTTTTMIGCWFALVVSSAAAHEPPTQLAQLGDSQPTSATTSIAGHQVKITVSGGERVIMANGLPDHAPGKFPNRGNPNRISAQNHKFRVPANPQVSPRATPGQGAWFGVALNGVPFEPGTGEFWNGQRAWNYEAKSGAIDLGLDAHNAHVQPTGLIQKLGGDGQKMLLVGWAADGFPIYTSYAHRGATNVASPLQKMKSSWQLKPGDRAGGPGGKHDGKFTADYEYVSGSGDLDECNGRYGVTPEFPRGTYHYCITEEFPQLARSWRGTPDASFYKRGPGPVRPERFGPDQGSRRLGAPPPPPTIR